MFVHMVPLLCLMQSTGALPATAVRGEHHVAVWFAPQVSRTTVLPVGVEIGVQLGRRGMVTGSYGRLPIQNIETSQWSFGGRWYLGDQALAPFLGAEMGHTVQERDDTGGRSDAYTFGVGGLGLEMIWARHFSLSTDLEAGPSHRSAGSYHDEAWLFALQYRLGLGVRF